MGPLARLPVWARVALVSVALLVVPLAAWLIVPEPEPPKRAAIRTSRENLPRQLLVEDEELEPEAPAKPTRSDPERAEDAPQRAEDVIRGLVVAGERIVSGAMINCRVKGGRPEIATAEHDGRFTLPLEAEGCIAVATSPTYGASPPVEMRRGAENRLELPGQGSIAGEVEDERGLPLARFHVLLDHVVLGDGSRAPGGTRRSFDDAQGRFVLENMGAGTWTLTVGADGKPSKNVDVLVEPGARAEVRVRLERGATLIGSVVDRQTKRAIGGARVTLDEAAPGPRPEPAISSPGGDFRLEGIPAGPFSLEVEHGDYLKRIVTGLDARGQRDIRLTIDLAPAGDAAGKTEMSGIGASLRASPEGQVLVAAVMEGGPAERAGLLADDVIAAIDGQSADGFAVSKAVQLLRGAPGTEVVVRVRRESGVLDISITREVFVH
jgi:hypothetical protein